MKENNEILNQLKGKENPFSVPDGYFDEFSSRIMSRLPKESNTKVFEPVKITRGSFMMKIISIAASVLLVLGVTGLFFNKSNIHDKKVGTASNHIVNTVVSDTYIDQAADYAMMDNQDIYACLSDE